MMRQYLSVVSILIIIDDGLTQIDFLMKFHQNDYKIKNIRVDMGFVNQSYFKIFNIIAFKYNRTTTAINGTVFSKIDMDNKLQFVVQGYKWASNEYRLFPIRFQYNVCDGVKMNVIGLNKLTEYGNLDLCKIKKGILCKFNNFVIDETRLPPFIPNGEFKFTNTLVYDQNKGEAGLFNTYGEVYRPLWK